MGIGKRIKEARERSGLTQKELSELLGVTPSAVTNYENETSHPKEPVMYKLFSALHCDANFLFQDEIKNSPAPVQTEAEELTHAEKHLIKNLRSLNNDGQEKLLDYSDDLVASGRYIIDNSISNLA
ncbi:MAG: helix-turn-helix transcriptional regulator [Ruminococcaceae bacterium]|jgi:transcriptional regulator with XRE-family HTH domain|nr:helix-turn-helix transcriptional regulator [Oscillospiraceae bacterium]